MTVKTDFTKLLQYELARIQPWQKAIDDSAKWRALVSPSIASLDHLDDMLADSHLRELDQLTKWTKLEAEKWGALAEPTRHLVDELIAKSHSQEMERLTKSIDDWNGLSLANDALRAIDNLHLRLPPDIEDAANAVTRILRDLDPRWLADLSSLDEEARADEAPSISRALRQPVEFASYDAFEDLAALESVEVREPSRKYVLSPVDQAGLTIALVALLVALLSLALQLEQRHIAKVDSAEEARFRKELLQAIRDLAPRVPEAPMQYVVALGPTTVRSEPARGYRVGVAHQNQVVAVTDHRGRWFKVRFRDHIEAREVEGWVLKHRLVKAD